jgi:predicted nucleic acid-binding protein
MPSANPLYRRFVIDTGALISALTLECIECVPRAKDSILKASSLPDYLKSDPATVTDFRALLYNAEEILVSSYVIGEIQSKHIPKDLRLDCWQSSVSFFDRRKVSERLVTLADLNGDESLRAILYENGPTDASLIALARREGCLLITDDEGLYKWQRGRSVIEVEMVKNIVRSVIDD